MKGAQLYPTLLRLQGLYSPWNSPGHNTGVGSLSLLQRMVPTQGSNPGIKPTSPALHEDSLPAEPQGKPLLKASWLISILQSRSSILCLNCAYNLVSNCSRVLGIIKGFINWLRGSCVITCQKAVVSLWMWADCHLAVSQGSPRHGKSLSQP